MSLFPAYSGNVNNCKEKPAESKESNSDVTNWLENNSYSKVEVQLKVCENQHNSSNEKQDVKNDVVQEISSDSDINAEISIQENPKKPKHKKDKKKHKKDKKEKRSEALKDLGLTGDEDFYVDINGCYQYKKLERLYKPACPIYKLSFKKVLGYDDSKCTGCDKKLSKRYYKYSKRYRENISAVVPLDESIYTQQLGELNRKTITTPDNLKVWLDLIELHQQNPFKWSRLMVAEKKIDLIERALLHNPYNELLYRSYIETINATYPSYEITKLINKLLKKDPYNYTLWTAQIMTTQGSMARCLVPDVLQIYERCMQKMHNADRFGKNPLNDRNDTDEVLLKLFNNCALFLRQAGLYEQFFALIKLSLELNVSTEQFDDLLATEADQNVLIEYEELILQSGLPMNEIWLRIEKIRECFNFLPYPANMKCSDPQRIVFNEDICHYIYPLKRRDNSFYLMLLILRLLKVPFVQCDGLADKICARVEHMGDSDAVEDILAICLRRSFALSQEKHDQFLVSIHEIAKEMAVNPTFLGHSLAFESYSRCIKNFLMNCAKVYEGVDERKRIVFIAILCRFERLLLIMEKCSKKLIPEYVKAGKNRFKSLLENRKNQDVVHFYTEYILYEYEALSNTDSIEGITKLFENVISANSSNECQLSDLSYLYVTYAEILISRDMHNEACSVIASFALSIDITKKNSISNTKKLSALQVLKEKTEASMAIEESVGIMVLEQYLLPDATVSLLKLQIYMEYLLGQKLEAIKYLDRLLRIFFGKSDRHSFLRENIYELYSTLTSLPSPVSAETMKVVTSKIFAALVSFPRNLYLLQRCSMLTAVPWYKVCSAVLDSNPSVQSILCLIASARFRFVHSVSQKNNHIIPVTNQLILDCDAQFETSIIRNRILNIFRKLAPESLDDQQKHLALRRNALFWRIYLSFLSNQTTSFEVSKKCLLTALDECPWSKALYLDGATHVPQELSHLQDLMIEKQLRMYALPEELDILREQ